LDTAIWESDFWIGVRGDWAMVNFLLQRGAAYPITIAAACGDTERVEAILAADPSQINSQQASGRRALSSAIQFGHLDLAKRLLNAGADPNYPEGRYVAHGASLFFAARDKHYELVSLLLERGASPNSGIDSCGDAYEVADAGVREQLQRYGFKPTMVDFNDTDAIAEWAASDPLGLARIGCGCIFTGVVKSEWDGFPNPTSDERKEEILRKLLALGVRVPPVVTGCRNYLWHKPRFTRILLDHRMDPNLPDWQRVTPLHNLCTIGDQYAPGPNRRELTEMFLEFGADINARDEEYRSTPLGWAARNGLMDMVVLLLEKGAAISLPDDEPWATPLAWAQKRGHREIAALLEGQCPVGS
jgi:ankyrin repeat protein